MITNFQIAIIFYEKMKNENGNEKFDRNFNEEKSIYGEYLVRFIIYTK
jgi:hypothetical protein